MSKQVGTIDKDLDLAFLHIGGNNAKLADLLNNCVYNFFLPGNCEDTIAQSKDAIGKLQSDIEDLLKQMLAKMTKPESMIMVPGYATFFNPTTAQCSSITFDYRQREDTNAPKLSTDQRQKYNDLVVAVNSAVQAATNKFPLRVFYVDIDKAVQDARGRFCAEGVNEPDLDRKQTLFYNYYQNASQEVHTDLRARDASKAISCTDLETEAASQAPPSGTFERHIFDLVLKDLLNTDLSNPVATGSRTFMSRITRRTNTNTNSGPEIVASKGTPPDLNGIAPGQEGTQKGVVGDIVSSLIPDDVKRVFHPNPDGHQMIASQVLKAIEPLMTRTTLMGDVCTPAPPPKPSLLDANRPSGSPKYIEASKDDVRIGDLHPD